MPLCLDPTSVDVDAPGGAGVDALDDCDAGVGLELQASIGSPPSSPAPDPSSLGVTTTPDTPAVPEGLGGDLVFIDEFEFERRQHELEVET